jgi:hypothetical protein
MTVKEAKRFLRGFQESQDIAPAVPTAERLNKAGEDYSIEDSISVEEIIGKDGRPTPETIERKRIRLNDSPLARLASRGLLAPSDKSMNMALRAAGEKYAEHWHNGTPTLGAMDPSKPFISDSRVPAHWQNEWQLGEWQLWLQASLVVYPVHRATVDAVVLHDRSPSDIARHVTRYTKVDSGVAVVIERLTCGLAELAMHFGMLDKNDLR